MGYFKKINVFSSLLYMLFHQSVNVMMNGVQRIAFSKLKMALKTVLLDIG